MKSKRQIAEKVFPKNAEVLTDDDWESIEQAVEQDRNIDDLPVEPIGEAKDAFLASLLIIYWTMKIASVALEVAQKVKHLTGPEKATAVLKEVESRTNSTTPKKVVDHIGQILQELGL